MPEEVKPGPLVKLGSLPLRQREGLVLPLLVNHVRRQFVQNDLQLEIVHLGVFVLALLHHIRSYHLANASFQKTAAFPEILGSGQVEVIEREHNVDFLFGEFEVVEDCDDREVLEGGSQVGKLAHMVFDSCY